MDSIDRQIHSAIEQGPASAAWCERHRDLIDAARGYPTRRVLEALCRAAYAAGHLAGFDHAADLALKAMREAT